MNTLQLRYANCLTSRVGNTHGITPDDLQNASTQIKTLTKQLAQMRASGEIRWRDLPFNPMRDEHITGIKTAAERVHDHCSAPGLDGVKHLIVLGIGGSALGNIALQAALKPWTHNMRSEESRRGPALYVLDNVDPQFVSRAMKHIEEFDPGLKHTVLNVVSKSGETAETASQFMIFQNWLKQHLGDDYANHVVAITDPKQGTMRSIVDREGFAALPVPDGVGGRFSVLSPVGLFSASMCGIDIDELLDGAAAMDERCQSEDITKNPAAMLAYLLITFTKRGKPNHVLMPYANALYSLADWYRQLWAESLGKKVDLQGNEIYAGATPIKALGTTDQHSQVQLYREGPNDKVIGFMEVSNFGYDITIPSGVNVDNLQYLEGKKMSELLTAEKRATEFALAESMRPNFTITFPEISAHTVGQFIQLWQVATAYAGLMLNINAYDQPAVETGKLATFGLMGRKGYEDWASKVSNATSDTDAVI